MKITIARLRSGTNYKEPLHDIMDSFYELYKRYMEKNPQHTYGVYNFGWGKRNRKILDDVWDSDVIIIPQPTRNRASPYFFIIRIIRIKHYSSCSTSHK